MSEPPRSAGTSATVATSYLQALFDYLRLRQVPAADILGDTRIDFADRDARVPEVLAAELFNRAAKRLDDDALGVHAGELIRPGHYGVAGYVGMACSTLTEAFACLYRYQAMVIDIGTLPPRLQGEELHLAWKPDEQSLHYRQLAEFNLAALLSFVRWITGRPLAPLRLEFPYPAPLLLDEQRRVFACPLRFDADCYRFVAPIAWHALPLIQPDPAMRALMDRLAEKQMLELRRGDDAVSPARRLLARQLSQGEATLERLAAELHLSPRTLQRKLQEQNLSFSQLLDEVRRELAERYLADPGFDLTDLAFLLGYSEHSAFTRAFKRWTGRSPAEYRATRPSAS